MRLSLADFVQLILHWLAARWSNVVRSTRLVASRNPQGGTAQCRSVAHSAATRDSTWAGVTTAKAARIANLLVRLKTKGQHRLL